MARPQEIAAAERRGAEAARAVLRAFGIVTDDRMAVDPDGNVKSASEFTPAEKWWCDGEDCGGDGPNGPDLPVPHVHCEMHTHLVDLLTGKGIDQDHA